MYPIFSPCSGQVLVPAFTRPETEPNIFWIWFLVWKAHAFGCPSFITSSDIICDIFYINSGRWKSQWGFSFVCIKYLDRYSLLLGIALPSWNGAPSAQAMFFPLGCLIHAASPPLPCSMCQSASSLNFSADPRWITEICGLHSGLLGVLLNLPKHLLFLCLPFLKEDQMYVVLTYCLVNLRIL